MVRANPKTGEGRTTRHGQLNLKKVMLSFEVLLGNNTPGYDRLVGDNGKQVASSC